MTAFASQYKSKTWAERVNWLWVAVAFNAAYGVWLLCSIGYDRIASFLHEPTVELNQVGDFLAGVFAPIALIWLVAAVLTQRQELMETRDQFEQSQNVVRLQLASVAQQNKNAEEQAIRNYKLSLFDHRIDVYNRFLHFFENQGTRERFRDFATELGQIHHKSRFLFGDDVSEYAREVSVMFALLSNYENEIISIKSGGKPVTGSTPVVIERAKKAEELANILNPVHIFHIFSRYLTVTDVAKEARLNVTEDGDVLESRGTLG